MRKKIATMIEEAGLTLKEASLRIDRSHSYFQQFIERGIPRKLKEDDRRKLSALLNIDESEIGGPPKVMVQNKVNDYVTVPEPDVHVSAGGGSIVEQETIRTYWPFNPDYLHSYLGVNSSHASIVEVRGDSMVPTLISGDKVMVNLQDTEISQDGIFVIYDGMGTVIKRVELDRDKDPVEIKLISDNKIHGDYSVAVDSIKIIGRVVWAARRL